ncbi:Alpha/beta hydrolase fold-1 [Diplogelasinospora grovesii]|uniref:Alpha/beta hydrolase fold-1 n=1 Tax=Diplogelasinospora grovesii TaxID=303347 RepID=A0AAN6N1K3_9PEZI|nr:Alpha/beta hydrolase fold-1 [Diplogelasinospora grovesii]
MASPAENKPTFLLVTGAWHQPAFYQPTKDALTALGYECVVPQMKAQGPDSAGVTWEADVSAIMEAATPLFEAGKEVVLIAHSYGGIPGTAVTKGQGVAERAAQGKRGGFHSIIFVAAFAIPQRGLDLLQTFGGQYPPWLKGAQPYSKNHLCTVAEDAQPIFCNDFTEEDTKKAFSLLLPQSQDSFETPADFVASDITIPKTYVICELDQVFPVPLQEMLVKSTPGLKEARIHASHGPFVSQPQPLAELIVKIVAGEQ